MSSATPDFDLVWRTYDQLKPGQKAELRRVAEPDDLRDYASVYRLFPGQPLDDRHLRLAFLLPWCEQAAEAPGLARQWLKEGVAEARILQLARAGKPNDIKQFRRLAMQVKPRVNWAEFGKTLWYWSANAKRSLVEQYYLAKFEPAKGGSK
jgi:CRISPR system Cascade subunit CasB